MHGSPSEYVSVRVISGSPIKTHLSSLVVAPTLDSQLVLISCRKF